MNWHLNCSRSDHRATRTATELWLRAVVYFDFGLLIRRRGSEQMRRSLLGVLAVSGLMFAMGSSARADVIDFYLTQGECTGTCGAGTAPTPISDSSAVEVMVNLTSSTSATVEFEAPCDPTCGTIDTPVYVKVNSTDFSATTNLPGGVVGSGSEDHYGTFNLGTAANENYEDVYLYLTDLGGQTWTDAAEVLTPTTNYGSAYSQGFEAVEGGGLSTLATTSPLPNPPRCCCWRVC